MRKHGDILLEGAHIMIGYMCKCCHKTWYTYLVIKVPFYTGVESNVLVSKGYFYIWR